MAMDVCIIDKDNKSIGIRIIKTELVNWRSLQFIQEIDFKEIPEADSLKLKTSLAANEFVQPFYIWEDPTNKVQYCLDGKHRTIYLKQLIQQGYQVPDMLPGTFIECKDKQEAANLVLVYSAAYAKITQHGFFNHVQNFNLSFPILMETIALPNLDLATMKDWFLPELHADETIGLAKNNPLTLKITFKDKEQVAAAENLIKEILSLHCPGAYYSVSGGEL